jgi:hypothetical protein
MNFRKWFIASICVLSLCGALRAQGYCYSTQLAGTYGLSMSGWATVAPGPTVVPFAALGAMTIDPTGSGSGPFTEVIAGQAYPPDNATFRLKLSSDCSLTFTADCSGGCHWEGTGTFYRAKKQIDLLFTKVGKDQIPVTVLATLKAL